MPTERGLGNMATADYQVTITMSPETVSALEESGFILYGFKAVHSSDQAGRPLIWYSTQNYSASTLVAWSEQNQVYTSTTPIVPNSQIVVGFSTDIAPGETLEVERGGIGQVVSGGPPAAISILNTTNSQFTCGASQVIGGTAYPTCAFPLYGNHLQVITPLEKVLLMFSTDPLNTGTVIDHMDGSGLEAYSPGLFIDLEGENQRAVSYDINLGWSWGGYSWAHKVPANADLVPMLIEP